jgi:ubiquinone/menaquinone biosynthesis C-methylase UbiE
MRNFNFELVDKNIKMVYKWYKEQEMNKIWSTYIQTIGSLERSRLLRFNDNVKELFKSKLNIENKNKLLEIGCGAGTLCNILNKWYPELDIIGIDRDTKFVEYAKANYEVNNITFMENDITKLTFPDNRFDVTISHTVQEHINPEYFFGEQYRVLKNNGICLILSSRAKNAIHMETGIDSEYSEFEKSMWERAEKYFKENHEKYPVCQFPMSEQELPKMMSKYGFRNISTDYISIGLTPDSNNTNRELAMDIINDRYQSMIEQINYLYDILPDIYSVFSKRELERWRMEIKNKQKERIKKYNNSEKIWETEVSIIMIMRGIK